MDAKEPTCNDIVTDNNGKMWIRKGRHKIKKNKARCTSNIPLLGPAIKILEKYKDYPKCVETGICPPFYSNANMNSYLKDIAASCGIDKNLTTHSKAFLCYRSKEKRFKYYIYFRKAGVYQP